MSSLSYLISPIVQFEFSKRTQIIIIISVYSLILLLLSKFGIIKNLVKPTKKKTPEKL